MCSCFYLKNLLTFIVVLYTHFKRGILETLYLPLFTQKFELQQYKYKTQVHMRLLTDEEMRIGGDQQQQLEQNQRVLYNRAALYSQDNNPVDQFILRTREKVKQAMERVQTKQILQDLNSIFQSEEIKNNKGEEKESSEEQQIDCCSNCSVQEYKHNQQAVGIMSKSVPQIILEETEVSLEPNEDITYRAFHDQQVEEEDKEDE
eukprot:TRINITY_DN2344_c0_g1_i21.p1 TRINITY_DN2344_c0_g1~~TRINITY_DN2344_c0_g1_i21.p1  ORF type:complete len:204 (-),score=22.23 TRINITY_DN2344_c0_g1_i21:331-942(-)